MTIFIESPERLLSIDFIHALADRIVKLDLSRLKTTDWLAETLYAFEGEIVDWNGQAVEIGPEIVDYSYGEDESCSWNSEVKRFAVAPPRRRPRKSILLRLALWDAAMKINATPVLR